MINAQYIDKSYEILGRKINPVVGRIKFNGVEQQLRRKEIEVLALLASKDGELVERIDFIAEIWDENIAVGEMALNNVIASLRKKLVDHVNNTKIIRTIPRKGYQLCYKAKLIRDNDVTDDLFQINFEVEAGWRLTKKISSNLHTETWIARSDASGAHKIYKLCRNGEHLRSLKNEKNYLKFLKNKLSNLNFINLVTGWNFKEPPYFLETKYINMIPLREWEIEQNPTYDDKLALVYDLLIKIKRIHDKNIAHQNLKFESIAVIKLEEEYKVILDNFGIGDFVKTSHSGALLTLTIDGLNTNSECIPPKSDSSAIFHNTAVKSHLQKDIYDLGLLIYQIFIADYSHPIKAMDFDSISDDKIVTLIKRCLDSATINDLSVDDLLELLPNLTEEQQKEIDSLKKIASSSDSIDLIIRNQKSSNIKNFRILDVLGEGGMGRVYLAEQNYPIKRKVALKVIKKDHSVIDSRLRFEMEIQSLGLMSHVNVASVYESGFTDESLPYFSMEYVPGLELDKFCDQKKLSINQRLVLVMQICSGVLHAHQKGIIHRDLNPSNILVCNEIKDNHIVKIIDFGIAKNTQANDVHTKLGSFLGKPFYASPEQINYSKVGVDTRTDIYSIGVIMYKLVSGQLPPLNKDQDTMTQLELLLSIKEGEIEPPSIMFSNLDKAHQEEIAALRSETSNALKKVLKNDLSWIIMKSLAKERDDRYESVLELKKDIQRWLNGRPVAANKVPNFYRIKKYFSRNKGKVLVYGTAFAFFFTSVALGLNSWNAVKIAQVEADLTIEFQQKQFSRIKPHEISSQLRGVILEEVKNTIEMSPKIFSADNNHTIIQAMERISFEDLSVNILSDQLITPSFEALEEINLQSKTKAKLYFSMAKSLYKLGLYNQSNQAINQSLIHQKSEGFPIDGFMAETYYYRSISNYYLWNMKQAKDDIVSVVNFYENNPLENQENYLKSKIQMTNILFEEGNISEARIGFDNITKIQIKLYGYESIQVQKNLNRIALMELRTGNYEKSLSTYQTVYKNLGNLVKESDSTYIDVIDNIGILNLILGNTSLAGKFIKEGYQLRIKYYGNNSYDSLIGITKLANFYYVTGDFNQSILYYKKSLEGLNNLLSKPNPDSAYVLFGLINSYHELNNITERDKYIAYIAFSDPNSPYLDFIDSTILNTLLEIEGSFWINLLSKVSPKTSDTLDNERIQRLPIYLIAMQKFNLMSASDAIEGQLVDLLNDERHQNLYYIPMVMSDLGWYYSRLGREDEAESLYLQSIELLNGFEELIFKRVGYKVYYRYAELLKNQNRFDESKNMYQILFERIDHLYEVDHPRYQKYQKGYKDLLSLNSK